MAVALSLACAVLAALSYGIGSVMQAAAARHADRRRAPRPAPACSPRPPVALCREPRTRSPRLCGPVVALRTLPLFLVQSALAASVGVTAVAASVVFGFACSDTNASPLVALMLGFALLAVSARPEHAAALGAVGQWILACGVVVVARRGCAQRTTRRPQRRNRPGALSPD